MVTAGSARLAELEHELVGPTSDRGVEDIGGARVGRVGQGRGLAGEDEARGPRFAPDLLLVDPVQRLGVAPAGTGFANICATSRQTITRATAMIWLRAADQRPALVKTIDSFGDWLSEWWVWARTQRDRRPQPEPTGEAVAAPPPSPSQSAPSTWRFRS